MSLAPSRAPASAPVPVLLVDDRPANLLALEAVLASPERELVVARSGREAVALVKQRDFAVVLLDVQMPDMDGFETAAQMRALAEDWPVPVIFVTGIDAPRRGSCAATPKGPSTSSRSRSTPRSSARRSPSSQTSFARGDKS